MNRHLRVLVVCAAAAAAGAVMLVRAGGAPAAQAGADAEILWDRWGVPHIHAPDLPSALHAFGWAQMESHGDLLLRLYGESRGRAAEYWGDAHLDGDRFVRRMGIPARASLWLAAQTPAIRAALDAFVAGINGWAARHADRLDDDVERVLPVVPSDILAHVQRVIHFGFVTGQSGVDGQAERWSGAGSNAWAVGPKRSASGHALLLANPHLPWGGALTWYEAQIVIGGDMVYGAALVGMPMPGIAFNDRLGWTHTNNVMDGADLYELELSGSGYRWEAGVRPFETAVETLRIRGGDGIAREERLEIRRSVHGPVIKEAGGKALALRVAGLDEPYLFEQYWQMARARSFAEFEAAIRRLQNPFYTVMYADRDGRILHLFGGRTPVRPPGDYAWSAIVPGTGPATLWTATHPYEELPKVVDPPSGWLQNANDAPWTTTFPEAISASAYPRYMAAPGMSLRAQQSAKLLDDDPSITFDEFVAYKHSTRMLLADRVLDDLLPAAKAAGGMAAEAAAVLEAWDRTADAGSRGAVLFQLWQQRLAAAGPIFARPWSAAAPRTTPGGLRNPGAAVAALAEVASAMRAARGALDVPWGDAYRLRVGPHDLPANGAPHALGVFRMVTYARDGAVSRATGGDSYVAAVEFGPVVRARTLIAYGNATQPGSPHIGDQLALFAKKQLKPAWLTRAEVEANLSRRETVRR